MTNTNSMTITRALAELKLLDSRIYGAISDADFGGVLVGKKISSGKHNSIEEVEKVAKASYQSIKDLIKRRNKIKSAIVNSNATTEVEVAGVKMTVAEAIERKSSIGYEKYLLSELKSQYSQLVSHADKINKDVEKRLDEHLKSLFGKDAKISAPEVESVVETFKLNNEAKIVDPINLKDKINELEKEIEEFLFNVDFVLSESNTINRITIE